MTVLLCKVDLLMAQTTALKPPAKGPINVAFVISEGANVMDIAGPWESSVNLP